MTSIIRRTAAVLFTAALVSAAAFTSAQAQCNQVSVTNNSGCNVLLCLYSLTGAAPVCWNVPTGPSTITFPAGFTPAGVKSNGGHLYAFDRSGCSPCYTQITVLPVICCAVVCFDRGACTITIDPCTQARCEP